MNVFRLSTYTDVRIEYSEPFCLGVKYNLLLNYYSAQIPRLHNRVPGKAWNNSRPATRKHPKRRWRDIIKYLIIFAITVLVFVLLFLMVILTG